MSQSPGDELTPASHRTDLESLVEHRRLLPLLPLIYVVWANGELLDEELATLREVARQQPWIDQDALEVLELWLDPEDPPSATELQALLRAVEEGSDELSQARRLSLVELGVQMVSHYRREEDGDFPVAIDEVRHALKDLEHSLGLVGVEAARQMRTSVTELPAPPTPTRAAPEFDVQALRRRLDGSHTELRDEVRNLLASDEFEYVYGLELDEYRQQVVEWLQRLADAGYGEKCFPDEDDGRRDLSEFLAVFETLGIFDLSLLVKFGVQFGLFGGSILFLGRDVHHQRYLPKVASLELHGCYAMTEMGRGSNVRDLETIARYDGDRDEFVIHTPTQTARKEWIGGAGRYASIATVYAQLIVDDEEYGVHAFVVPIRDEQGDPLPGVRIEDQGLKMGLNGVDNGRIWFDHVRIPRQHQLDRYGGVNDEGEYESPIPSKNRRFFTMLGTLVAGRLGVSAAGLSSAKVALTIATRYGARRRQFGPAGKAEVPLLEYRMHQRALMPRLASAYALTFALHEVMDRYHEGGDEQTRRHTEALAAGLKAYSSWFAVDAVQASRECCGGQGYLTVNRLSSIRRDVDVFVTFEGANIVMMQQVARALLADFRSEVGDGNFFSLARLIARQAARTLTETNPVVIRNTSREHLRSAEFQLNAFRYREHDLLVGLARRLKRRIDDGMDTFMAFNDCQDHAVALARAHVERFVLESFVDAEADCQPQLKPVLQKMRNLFALARIEDDVGWFLENNYVQSSKAAAIRDQVNELCAEVRDDAVALVDAFGIPDECLSAPIAFADEKAPAEARSKWARGVAREGV